MAAGLAIAVTTAITVACPAAAEPVTNGASALSPQERARLEREAARQQRILRKEGPFGAMTAALSTDERIRLCGFVAGLLEEGAAQTVDPALRADRMDAAARFDRRLQPLLDRARAGLSPAQLAAADRYNAEAVGILGTAPDPWLDTQLETAAGEEDTAYLFPASLARHCDRMIDRMKVPRATGQ